MTKSHDQDENERAGRRRQTWLLLIATGAISGAGAILLNQVFPDWRLQHYPLHAAVESIGAFAAFIVAGLILSLKKHGHLGPAYTWVASALIGMGFLDGLHSLLYAGNGFVWLHSIATLIGGGVFALVWGAEVPLLRRLSNSAPKLVLVCVPILGITSLIYPESIPQMVVDGQFSFWAKASNIVGGIGFLSASLYFAIYSRQETDSRNRLIFSSHCFLFGISGVIFEFSVIWDAAWWLWHLLRICAYLIAVLFYFRLAKKIEEELSVLKSDLEVRVEERTQALADEAMERQLAERKYRESEARTRQILNSTVDGIYGVDLDGLCTFTNPAAAALLGYDANELIGRKQHDILHHTRVDGSPYPVSECPIYLAFKDGVEREVSDEVFWRKDGSSFYVEYTSTPILEDGNIKGAVVVFRDVDERRNLQAQLVHSSKLATLGEMATGVAHELNQPLNVIRMAASNVLRRHKKNDLGPEYMVEKLERITRQTVRASEIIDHMRIFGRRSEREPHPVDLNKAANDSLSLVGEQIRLAGIDIEVALANPGPQILGHATQVEQIILNLLNNAVDAINSLEKEDGAKVSPKRIDMSTTLNREDNTAILRIADSGGGIAPSVLERIFEPFYTTKEVGKGTGLGLSISYGIITEMRGKVSVQNIDAGAEFVVTLPLDGNATNDHDMAPG